MTDCCGRLSEVLAIYQRSGLVYTTPAREAESDEYDACRFVLNGKKVIYRQAKVTPKKVGQFVTVWQRNPTSGTIEPFRSDSDFDFVVVGVCDGSHHGQFVFPKAALAERGVISSHTSAGKRGFRVYPEWDEPTSKQAKATQAWQALYFFEDGASVNGQAIVELLAG